MSLPLCFKLLPVGFTCRQDVLMLLLWLLLWDHDQVSAQRHVGVQVNERYIPQLQEVLQWPQSIGIVGGRPSSSLYFVGCQQDQVLYLDPHQAQQVGPLPLPPHNPSRPSCQTVLACPYCTYCCQVGFAVPHRTLRDVLEAELTA